jgi:hypothetical protein
MDTHYAILNEQGGWLENLVCWDGDTTHWQPPAGTRAVPLSEIDLQALPARPEDEQSAAGAWSSKETLSYS